MQTNTYLYDSGLSDSDVVHQYPQSNTLTSDALVIKLTIYIKPVPVK